MKTICTFNHKGGVGKTSITYSLGWILTLKGYKPLLVDLDSQCNLTSLALRELVNEDKLEELYQNPHNLTMESISQQIIEGRNVDKILSNNTKLYPVLEDKLFLLPGHLDVSDLDPQLTIALKTASTMPFMTNIVLNFIDTIQTLGKQYEIDYILIDLGPHISGISEVMIMSSDSLIIPTSSDYFCLQAVSSLTNNIEKWFYEIEQFNSIIKLRNNHSFQVNNYIKTLGLIQQQKGLSSNIWNKRIEEAFNDILIPRLSSIGFAPNQYEKTYLPYLDDFDTFINLLEHNHKDMNDDMLRYMQNLSLFANHIL